MCSVEQIWLDKLKFQVHTRNATTSNPFDSLIDTVGTNQQELARLRGVIDKLREEKSDLAKQLQSGGGGGASAPTNAYVQGLEEKVRDLQEQQRRWVDDARIVMDAQKDKKTLQTEVDRLDARVRELTPFEASSGELQKEVEFLRESIAKHQDENSELSVIRNDLNNENDRLRVIAMELKSKEADRMNDVFELEKRLQQASELNKSLKLQMDTDATWPESGSFSSTPETGARGGGKPAGQKASHAYEVRQKIQPPTQLLKKHIQCHKNDVNTVVHAPNGMMFATAGNDKVVRLWDSQSYEEKSQLRQALSPVLRVEFSPTGDILVGGTSDGSTVLWSTSTCRHLYSLGGHSTKVTGLCFADDKTLLTCSGDRTIRRWDLNRSGACTKTTMCWSNCQDLATGDSGGSVVASAHYDGGLRFWDTRTVNSVEELKGAHTQAITSVGFSHCGNRVITSSRDGSLKIFDVRNYQESHMIEMRDFQSILNTAKTSISPCDSYVAIGIMSDGASIVQAYDTLSQRPKLRASLKGGHEGGQISQVSWAPDGSHLVSVALDGSFAIWGT